MASALIRKFVIPALVATAVVFPALAAEAPATTALGKTEIESIVKDYIMNNPEVILSAVESYQKKSMGARQSAALKDNHDMIYKDESSPFIGDKDGDVTIVEFFDYNCGYCKKALPELRKVIESDKKVKIIFKDFPILGPTSETSAKWALAAHKQGKYFDYHAKMMEHKGAVDDALLEKIAGEVGMDVSKAKADIQGTEILIQIEKNRSLASELGLTGTPAFLVGDKVVPGMIGADQLKAMIADQRKGAAEPAKN